MKHIISIVFFTLSFSIVGYSQGRLEKAEKSIKKEKTEQRTRNSRDLTSESSESSFASSVIGGILSGVIEGIFMKNYESSGTNKWLTKYPYYNSKEGNYSYYGGANTTAFRTTLSSRFVIADSKLYGNHFQVQFQTYRIGLEVDYLQLWEQNNNFGDNSLAITNMIANITILSGAKANFDMGLGATYAAGEISDWGFTITGSTEWFFVKPLSIKLKGSVSFFDSKSEISTITTLLNYHHRGWKISGGFEYLKIGSEDFYMPSIGLGISL